jgi:N-acetylglucosaminyldiphosphoundecaprenol N-acetyl-beta-D-mannosaminyltransferase
MDAPSQMPRLNVLGIGVSAVNMDSAVEAIGGWIDAGERHYVCVTSVHGVMESWRSSELREIHNRAGMVTPDGMPLAWLLRLAGHRGSDRVCGPELMPRLLRESQARGHRHFLYGSTETTLARLREAIGALAPHAQIVGVLSPPFRRLTEEEDAEEVAYVNSCRPDVVWVGLSTPKQERWMATHRARLSAPVLIGVGAAFDIHAGLQKRAPHFMRRSGLEWTWRLISEPRRLWRRYLANNPYFVMLICLQWAGLLRGQLDVAALPSARLGPLPPGSAAGVPPGRFGPIAMRH